MTQEVTILLIAGFISMGLAALIPGKRGLNLVSLVTLAIMLLLAPLSGALLLVTTLIIPSVLGSQWSLNHRRLVSALLVILLLLGLTTSRMYNAALWIGVSYFTLRHLHVIIDWWLGRFEAPRTLDYFRYQFFLPTILTGPIHRFPSFDRESTRRRGHPTHFFVGLERILIGLASVIVIANWLLIRLADASHVATIGEPLFVQRWVEGLFDWLQIYFAFGGFSAIAIGLAQIAGVKIEENFNSPWRATHLVDFWSRWHITLSSWIREYLHAPIAAYTRSSFIAALVSMVAMGLWHEFSAYYVLWGLWQGLGIGLTQYILKNHSYLPSWPLAAMVPLWLTLTKPVALFFLDLV